MWEDAETGARRIDPVGYFESRRGLRTVGYAKHRSQVVFGSDAPEGDDGENMRFRRHRARGPGKDFGRFVEMFGFPERRPPSSSQKRIFAASALPGSINIFQWPSESVCRERVANKRGHRQSQCTEPPVSSQVAPQEQRDDMEDVTQGGEGGTESLHDDEAMLAENSARIRLLEQALAHEKRRMHALQERKQLGMLIVAPPTDAAPIQKDQQQQQQQQQQGQEEGEEQQYNGRCNRSAAYPSRATEKGTDDNAEITPKITSTTLLAHRCETTSRQPTAGGRCVPPELTQPAPIRRRSSWTLAEHYAGWR